MKNCPGSRRTIKEDDVILLYLAINCILKRSKWCGDKGNEYRTNQASNTGGQVYTCVQVLEVEPETLFLQHLISGG